MAGEYCTQNDLALVSGLAIQVSNEAVGTGDASDLTFSLDYDQIVKSSYTIYVDGTAKTETTDYSLNTRTGEITFVTAPALGKAITAQYKYLDDDWSLSGSDLDIFILMAMADVDEITGEYYPSETTVTDYYDGRKSRDFIRVTDPYERDFILLDHTPVTEITSVLFLDDEGNTEETLTVATDCAYKSWGQLIFLNHNIPSGTKNIKVVYKYGLSGASTVPTLIRELTALLAAKRMLANLIGSSYDDITSSSLGSKAITIGEVYVNVREVFDKLQTRIEELKRLVGTRVNIEVV